jgi:hypothetical protein
MSEARKVFVIRSVRHIKNFMRMVEYRDRNRMYACLIVLVQRD